MNPQSPQPSSAPQPIAPTPPTEATTQPGQPLPPVSIPGKRPSGTQLFKQSFQILKGDKDLITFPIMSILASLASAIIIGLLYTGIWFAFLQNVEVPYIDYIGLFFYYLVQYFIVMYFNVGLAASVLLRFQGGDPTYSYGMKEAGKHKKAIFGYALLASTIGVLLQIASDRLPLAGRIVAAILGAAWSIATIFIAPVLLVTNLSPLGAIKESARIFTATWGKVVLGSIGFFLVSFLSILIGAMPLAIGAAVFQNIAGVIIGGVLTLMLWVIASIIISTCSAIYRTALYHYATTRTIPTGFDQGLPLAIKAKK